MDSETNSSVLPPSTTLDSVEAKTWAHTRPAHNGERKFHKNAHIKYSTLCTELPPYGTSIATNMRNLESEHQIFVESTPDPSVQATTLNQLQQLHIRAESLGQTEEIDTQIFQEVLDQEVINEALISLIVVRNLPFQCVEWPEFRALCRMLNPLSDHYITTSHSQISKMIERSWQAQKDIIRKRLQSAVSSIHLSLDIWTSPSRLPFLGICAHFVGQDLKKSSKALLALRTVVNRTGDEQFTTLLPVLQDYGIVRKLGSIVCNNAITNDALCRTVGTYLWKKEKIEWDSQLRRIRCTGHIINLAVQAFLFQNSITIEQLSSYDEEELIGEERNEVKRRDTFRNMGSLGKLHNIVVHIRGSAGRTKQFKDLAEEIIPLNDRTRWNSWYQMLKIAIKHASAVDTYMKEHFDTLQPEYLAPKDWEKLRTICRFLESFNEATLVIQRDQATIDRVIFTMDVLIRVFEKGLIKHSKDSEISARIRSGWETFDKYYSKTDDSFFYATAIILHPGRRTKYIQHNWKNDWQKPALRNVKKLWEVYRDKISIPIVTSSYEEKPYQDLSEFDRVVRDLSKFARPANQDEYENYTNGELSDIRGISVLEWWCQDQQKTRWPRLSYMAIDILSIPAMSDEPERVFSGVRRTIPEDKAQLGAEDIERLECLKHWQRSGISEENLEIISLE